LSDMIQKKLYSMDLNLELFTYESQKIPANFIKWDTCSKMYKKILELDAENYDGIIQISSFNCGCDSIMVEFFKKAIREKGIPYMVLLLDEHSASVGMDTRLEVFVDSIRGQK
jgi:predicted nucleotide-binding protein (sugar kinase/HSP70/actin superfamily)